MKTNYSISVTKLIAAILITGSAYAAFATLGEGKANKPDRPVKSLLSNKTRTNNNNFSLRSGYVFRGSQVINPEQRYVSLKTTLTYRRGATTYVLPVQKKVFLDKVIFNDDLLRNKRAY